MAQLTNIVFVSFLQNIVHGLVFFLHGQELLRLTTCCCSILCLVNSLVWRQEPSSGLHSSDRMRCTGTAIILMAISGCDLPLVDRRLELLTPLMSAVSALLTARHRAADCARNSQSGRARRNCRHLLLILRWAAVLPAQLGDDKSFSHLG